LELGSHYCIIVEVGDQPLIFVIKMDEAEIIHAKKLERISISIMNRALNPEITNERLGALFLSASREGDLAHRMF